MENSEMVLKLSRRDAYDVSRALSSVIANFRRELRSPELTEDRKKVCESSLEMWKRLKDSVDTQVLEQAK